ncbi:MAG: hypothetical protein E7668_04025 [Ruminococcaceae bacterium]|nr:hypothetical protein [Oscillospiraceae bacterium]
MSKNERKSFILYHSFMNQFGLLTMQERGELITAIFEYDAKGTLPKGLSRPVEMAFSFIKDTMDRDREEYMKIVEKRSEGGKKGGRPKKEERGEENLKDSFFNEKTLRFFEKAKKPDNENENVNVIDNDNVNESENECISPTASPSLSAAPQLSQEEKQSLLNRGVSPAYLREKADRAALYAHGGKRVADILWDWWQSDRERMPSGRASPRLSEPSYDIDSFFDAAWERSLHTMEQELSDGKK